MSPPTCTSNTRPSAQGWLLEQLKLQADGLSGHLAMFWNDIQHSIWLNGPEDKGDAGLHKRGPYWLNGFVPLAYQLKAAGIDTLYPKCGIEKPHAHAEEEQDDERFPVGPVNPMGQVKEFIGAILASVNETDGWVGPGARPVVNGKKGDGNIYWGRSNAMFSLLQYAEAEKKTDPAEFTKVATVMKNYFLCQKKMMAITPIAGWAAARWIDMALSVSWIIDQKVASAAETAELMDLGKLLHEQGSDWDQWFMFAGKGGRGTGNAGGHNVNNAQALKSSAVWYLFSGNTTMRAMGKSAMARMDAVYGLPTGMFNGDEIIPDPPTRNPSRGIETCGVVEAMFSYTTLGAVHGDVEFFDRAEKIAFNAMPAAWASPRGGDMWAHPYLQAVNEVNAIKADPHAWGHDGDMSETYGLEPNYGCCTANFNQGWPKFIKQVVMASPDGGAAVTLLVPSTSTLADGSTVKIDTTYPFEDTVKVTCSAKSTFPLYIRIPAWAKKATVDGKAATGWSKQSCSGASTTFTIELAPEITIETWAADKNSDGQAQNPGYSVVRGPLLYSMPITHNYTVYAHHFGSGDEASNDYYLNPTEPWNYALAADPANPTKDLTFTAGAAYADGAAPFNRTGPLSITAKVQLLPSWGMAVNSAAPPPKSPACQSGGCGVAKTVQLVPHGYTELRIGEFPLA